eukprot:GHVN01051522.1.p1 GENE.GHVN01051522.1~~GHVN01051522.1.p1  ORF type:complete len:104 (-),score=21.48 GHVN01051522.1:139-450(-)
MHRLTSNKPTTPTHDNQPRLALVKVIFSTSHAAGLLLSLAPQLTNFPQFDGVFITPYLTHKQLLDKRRTHRNFKGKDSGPPSHNKDKRRNFKDRTPTIQKSQK